MVLELERRLRVTEPVIKFITVRMDEEEKRLAKVKALRGTRRKVSAEPAARPPCPACRTGSPSRLLKLPSAFRPAPGTTARVRSSLAQIAARPNPSLRGASMAAEPESKKRKHYG